MDILFLVKAEHARLEDMAAALTRKDNAQGQATGAEALRRLLGALQVFLALDEELIYPEISSLLPGGERLAIQGLEQHAHLRQLMAAVEEIGDEASLALNIKALQAGLQKHISMQQGQVLLRLRELIPTQEREDLGQVYVDMKEELAVKYQVALLCEQVG